VFLFYDDFMGFIVCIVCLYRSAIWAFGLLKMKRTYGLCCHLECSECRRKAPIICHRPVAMVIARLSQDERGGWDNSIVLHLRIG